MVQFADEAVVGGGESVGARLRRAREAHGLSLDDICARTRVPTRHLKSIEEDAYDQLPAAPYSVGFAKAFADAVGLNRDEIGREFRAEKEGYGASDVVPAYDPPEREGSGFPARWIALVVLVIAAAVGGLWWNGMLGGSGAVEAPAGAPSGTAATGPAAAPEAPAPTVSPPVANEAASETAKAGSETARSSTEKDHSATKDKGSSETQGEATTGSSTAKGEGKEEKSAKKESGSTGSTGTSATGEAAKPAFPSTRDLNLNAQHSLPAAPSSAAPATPVSAPPAPPPIISPPPPPTATPAPAAPAP